MRVRKLVLCAIVALAALGPGPGRAEETEFAKARLGFQTRLTREGPAPQEGERLRPPRGSVVLRYGKAHELTAFASKTRPGERAPVVVFLHGGFAWGASDWDMASPYRDAGFLTVTPALRGENGQPGSFSFFYDEVDDLVSLVEGLARAEGVDPARIFVAGHSAGGTLALLTSQASAHVRAAASFSGSPDQAAFIPAYAQIAPFDIEDAEELRMRSPDRFVSSFRAPTRAYFGSREPFFAPATRAMAERARTAGRDVEAVEVPGDHFSAVPEAMRRSIAFFRTQLSAAP